MHALNLLAQANNSGGAAAGGAFLGIWCLFALLALAFGAFNIWMLVDVLGSNKPSNEKLLWALIILLTGVGGLLYFFIGRGKTTSGL